MPFSKDSMHDSRPALDLAAYRAELHEWLDAHHEQLAPRFAPPGTLDDHIAQMQRVKAILFAAGWMQFGRPIATFQAARHRLADTLVAVEALEATLTAAREEPNPDTAALAKAVAGRTASTVAAHCQQVLAGIGFTTEHPFHRFLKRTIVLEGLFGSADEIALAVGRQLLAARHVPTLIEL
jgi:alkylation response protein AidB-like acyl-CoA dehydrogenase